MSYEVDEREKEIQELYNEETGGGEYEQVSSQLLQKSGMTEVDIAYFSSITEYEQNPETGEDMLIEYPLDGESCGTDPKIGKYPKKDILRELTSAIPLPGADLEEIIGEGYFENLSDCEQAFHIFIRNYLYSDFERLCIRIDDLGCLSDDDRIMLMNYFHELCELDDVII